MNDTPAVRSEVSLKSEDALVLFKLYEEAAEKTKAQAWSQTTWLLTLNAGIIAFSLDFYANHADTRGALLIECIAAVVGIVLCLFLIYLLHELGRHLSHYWTTSNQIALAYHPLTAFISKEDSEAARAPGCRTPFPKFCRRLQYLTLLFLGAHVGWVCIAIALLPPHKRL